MGSSPKHLTSRQIERLKSELAEVIITHLCYPSFFDYRLDALRTRPVDRRKRQEVWNYINALPFGPLSPEDVGTIEFRRFVERVFLRYIEINRGLIGAISTRRVTVARSRVSELAATVIKDLSDFLTVGDSSTFGLARPVEPWGKVHGKPEPTWEQIERSTQLLQTTLVYLHTNAAREAEQISRPTPIPPALQPAPFVQPAQPVPPGSPVAPRETPTPAGPGGAKASPAAPQREESAAVSISALPTQLLPPRPPPRVSHPVLGSKGNAREYETVPLEFPSSAAPIPRRQFSPLSRPRTASRPISNPLPPSVSTPVEPPVDVASLETVKHPLVPPAGPATPVNLPEPALPPSPTNLAAAGGPPGPPSGPVAPSLVAPAGQNGSAPAESRDETWLSILSETSGVHALGAPGKEPPGSGDGNSVLLLDSGLVLANGAGSPVGPYGASLPDLPEAFPLPELADLPPDLAELYGEYLRDSRSGSIDAAAHLATKEQPRGAGDVEQDHVGSTSAEQGVRIVSSERAPAAPQQAPAAPQHTGTSYLVAPEKAEVDALIAALADHVAEPPGPARQEPYQESDAPAMPATLHPFQLRGHIEQAKMMAAPAGAVPAAPVLPVPVQPARPVESQPQQAEVPASSAGPASERREAVSGPVQPTNQAEPMPGRPAPLGAPPTVPLVPKITHELRPLPGEEQDALARGALTPGVLEETRQGAKETPATFSAMAAAQPEKEMTEADVLIFVQLQHQVSTWVKIAAVSHQIEITGQDIPELVAELRHTAALEEAELQVIESLVALCQRVTSTRQATMEDYKQAMMLYLLHHRSRMAL